MVEKEPPRILVIDKEDTANLEKYNLVNWLGNHFVDDETGEKYGAVRGDLSKAALRMVKAHVSYHIRHDKPHRSKLTNEVMAFLVPGLLDPVGFMAAGRARYKQKKEMRSR